MEQADHYNCIQQDPADIHYPWEDKTFVCSNDGTENAHRESDSEIQDQKYHHYPCLVKLHGSHCTAEHCIHIEVQGRTGNEGYKSNDNVQNEEHSKHFILLGLLSFSSEFSGISDYSIA